jgi:hypothetical protein
MEGSGSGRPRKPTDPDPQHCLVLSSTYLREPVNLAIYPLLSLSSRPRSCRSSWGPECALRHLRGDISGPAALPRRLQPALECAQQPAAQHAAHIRIWESRNTAFCWVCQQFQNSCELHFLLRKDKFFSCIFFFYILVIKTLDPNLDSLEMLDRIRNAEENRYMKSVCTAVLWIRIGFNVDPDSAKYGRVFNRS